ncbi:hypothetical protein A7K50_12490 [Dehalobacter sp. MCB1]|uniref:hypothetical protein n=1 Tax=Dehalobacter sp. MCB1 TaxID=1844756 RepID=UPI000E6BB927|nr:hypothetical protein [Dehalobacter sp. MCB1]RJE46836.1 hypothetical protein A7K50_12490 [Dehalobacter sp. MCB1]
MVHTTAARREARGLKERARELDRESKALEAIEDAASMAGEKEAEASRLRGQARELQEKARLEDITVREEPLVKKTKKGEKTYYRWVAAWRVGGKYKKVYVGSCRKMDQAEALQKARKLKAEALAIKQ